MNCRLILRPDAELDISETRDWYESHRAGLGKEFLLAVDQALARIRAWPESCAAEYKKVRRAGVRRFPYVVYYRFSNGVVEVLAVMHGHRHPRAWRSRA
jgi:plasmid stabilization system protein ParE